MSYSRRSPTTTAESTGIVNLLRRLTDRQSAPYEAPPALRVVPPPPPAAEFQKTQGRDQLTGLPNRPCFTHYLAMQSALASQLETRLSLLVIDWEGYMAPGAKLDARNLRLAEIATLLRATLRRPHDMLGSLGRGRFAALLPFTDATGADHVANNLRAALRTPAETGAAPSPPSEAAWSDPLLFGKRPVSVPPPNPGGKSPAPTASGSGLKIGLASYCGKGSLPPDALLLAAERAADLASLDGATHTVRLDLDAAPS